MVGVVRVGKWSRECQMGDGPGVLTGEASDLGHCGYCGRPLGIADSVLSPIAAGEGIRSRVVLKSDSAAEGIRLITFTRTIRKFGP